MLLIKTKQNSDYMLARQRYLQLLLLSDMFDAQTYSTRTNICPRHFFLDQIILQPPQQTGKREYSKRKLSEIRKLDLSCSLIFKASETKRPIQASRDIWDKRHYDIQAFFTVGLHRNCLQLIHQIPMMCFFRGKKKGGGAGRKKRNTCC